LGCCCQQLFAISDASSFLRLAGDLTVHIARYSEDHRMAFDGVEENIDNESWSLHLSSLVLNAA
jgi:hypothetical protein